MEDSILLQLAKLLSATEMEVLQFTEKHYE